MGVRVNNSDNCCSRILEVNTYRQQTVGDGFLTVGVGGYNKGRRLE